MLVLTVKDGERIRLRDDTGQIIHVSVVMSAKGRAKIGIDAPETVEIMRESLVRKEATR
jgi:carbon storage regulator CsrA